MNIEQALKCDPEFSGELNASLNALGEGARFALILASMDADVVSRFRFSAADEQPVKQALKSDYPSPPLYADEKDLIQLEQIKQAIDSQAMASARLLHCLQPAPLCGVKSDYPVPEEVRHNCGRHAQERLKAALKEEKIDPVIDSDATKLVDILDTIHNAA